MGTPKKERLKEALDKFYKGYDRKSRIASDPIEFPHQYKDPLDIEIAGLIASSLAYGKVDLFKPVIRKILDLADGNLSGFVRYFNPATDLNLFKGISYRFNKEKDIACFVYLIGHAVKEYGSIGALFMSLYKKDDPDIKNAMIKFTDYLMTIDTTPIYGHKVYPDGLKQFLPSPKDKSACKRLNLYLRWMVRSGDGVDFGLWDRILPSKLIIPLDTHIARICLNLGLTNIKNPGWSMADEITGNLRLFDPIDPVKYDFALCHMGISGKCGGAYEEDRCPICGLKEVCSVASI